MPKVINLKGMFLLVSRYLIPKGYGGMTIYPFVILRKKEYCENAVFVNHEKIHIRQQAEMLILLFFVWYFLEFFIRLLIFRNWKRAYHNISFEREAYANEHQPGYLHKRPFWAFLKYYRN